MATKHKSVRFDENVLAVYAEQAEIEGRTVSNLINFALSAYAQQMGWPKEPAPSLRLELFKQAIGEPHNVAEALKSLDIGSITPDWGA